MSDLVKKVREKLRQEALKEGRKLPVEDWELSDTPVQPVQVPQTDMPGTEGIPTKSVGDYRTPLSRILAPYTAEQPQPLQPFDGYALPDSTPTVQDPKVFFDEFKNTRIGKILFRDFETKTPEDKVKFLQSIYSRYGNFDKDKLKPTIQKYDQDNSVLAGIKDWIGIQAPQMIEGIIGMLSQIPTRVNYGDTERPKQKPITNPFGLTDVRKKNEAYRQEFAIQSPLVAEFTQNFMNIVPVIATGGTAGLIGGAPAAFAASIATGFAMEGGSAYQEAYDYTKDPDTALGVGIAVGTTNSILNAIPIKGMAERQTAGVIKRFTRSLLNTKGKKEAVKKIGMAVLGEAHKTGKSELITEGLQELPNLIAEFLYKQGEDKPEFKEAAERILKAAASGYFIAGSIGAGGGVSQAVSGAKQGNAPIDRQARMRKMAGTPEETLETVVAEEVTSPAEIERLEKIQKRKEGRKESIEIPNPKDLTETLNKKEITVKPTETKSAQPETPPKTPDIKTPETTPADAKQPVAPEPKEIQGVQSEQPSVETGTEPSAQAVPAITEEVPQTETLPKTEVETTPQAEDLQTISPTPKPVSEPQETTERIKPITNPKITGETYSMPGRDGSFPLASKTTDRPYFSISGNGEVFVLPDNDGLNRAINRRDSYFEPIFDVSGDGSNANGVLITKLPLVGSGNRLIKKGELEYTKSGKVEYAIGLERPSQKTETLPKVEPKSEPKADTPSDPAMLDMIKRGKTDEEIVSALNLSKEQQKELKGLRESAGKKEPWQMTRGEFYALFKDDNEFGSGYAAVPSWDDSDPKWDVYEKFIEPARKTLDVKEVLPLVEKYGNKINHFLTVRKALSEGKPVPKEVLAEYPELTESATPVPKAEKPVTRKEKLEARKPKAEPPKSKPWREVYKEKDDLGKADILERVAPTAETPEQYREILDLAKPLPTSGRALRELLRKPLPKDVAEEAIVALKEKSSVMPMEEVKLRDEHNLAVSPELREESEAMEASLEADRQERMIRESFKEFEAEYLGGKRPHEVTMQEFEDAEQRHNEDVSKEVYKKNKLKLSEVSRKMEDSDRYSVNDKYTIRSTGKRVKKYTATVNTTNMGFAPSSKSETFGTLSEAVDYVNSGLKEDAKGDYSVYQSIDAGHANLIGYAIKAGETIPDEVLKDYPELAEEYQKQKGVKPKAEVKETPKPKEVAKVTPRTEEQQKAIDNFKKENVEKLFKNITNPEDAEKAVEELIFDGYPITHPKGIAGYLKNPTKKLPAWVKNSLRDIGNTEVAKEISGDEVAITPVKVKQNQSTEAILQDITPNNDPLREFMGTIYHDKGRGNIVATDGHTMVVLGSGTDKEGAYYTPERKKKELQDFAKTLPGDKEALADYAKRIEEPANIKYPNYWDVFPADPNKDKFTLDLTDDLIGKIETISMVNKAGDLPNVTGAFKIGESEILFSPYNFNRVYKALKSAGAQDLTAYISDKGRAIVILDKNNPTKYTGLVMPIRKVKVAREHGKDIVTEPIILSDTTPNKAFPKEYIEAHKPDPVKKAIDDVKADTNDLSINPFFNPKAYKNLIKVGGAFIKQGATNFKDWSAKMLSSFGAKIRPHLRKLWGQTLDWVNRKIDAKYGTEKLKSEQKERLAKLAGIDLTPEPEKGVSPLEPLQRFSGRWVYEKLGEQYRAVEELVENIARAGIELSDAEDPYLNISLSPGVLERRTKDLLEPAVKKMAKKLQSSGISIEDFSDYLYARSAKTRNQIIAQRQIEEQEEARVSAEEAGKEFKPKDIMTNGSGLTDEQADKIMDAFKKKENFDAYESSANDFWDSVIKPNIDLLYESGRIDEATRDEFLARKDYVPLKGVDYEMHSSTNSGSGYTVNNRGFYTAEGRESLAQNNTFLQMLEDFQSNIVGSVKNQAGQSLLKALEKAPSSMYEITGARGNQRLKDNQVSVYVDGKRKIITFKGEGEQISNALRNLDQSQVTHFGKVVDGINDYFRNVHTISNPEFVVPNALMDAQMGIVGLYADHGAGMVKKLFSNKGANLKFALRGLLDDMSGKDSPEADYYKNVYQKSGAKVGWVNTMELSQRYEEIQTLMKEAEKGVGNVKAIIRLVQALTNVSDNLIRLSVHKTLTDSGMSPKRASLYTRRLTVDFNRKGTWSKSVGRMYLFANAVAQGALRVKNIIGGKRGKKVMGGLVAAGAIQALMNIMLGEDEYESLINNREGILDTHWVIMVPGGGSVRVKSVPGLNFFTNLGRQAVETAFGLRTPGSALSSAIGNAFNSVNIMGESGDFWQWLSPTFTDPIIQGIQNKDFAGNPIRPLPRYKEDKPQSQKYFKTVGVPFKLLSEGLNAMTGGSKYRSGGVDVSPNDFEFAFEALTGGLGRFTTKVAKTATAPLAEEYGISDMPFLSRFGLPPQEKAPENIVYRMLQQAPTKEFTDRQKKYFERNVDIMVRQGKEDSKKGNTLKREFEREQSDDYKELRSVIKEAKAGGEKDWSKFRNLTVKLLRSRIITRQDLEKYKKEMR